MTKKQETKKNYIVGYLPPECEIEDLEVTRFFTSLSAIKEYILSELDEGIDEDQLKNYYVYELGKGILIAYKKTETIEFID